MQNNPYVGPRPYERQDRHNFYGRDHEARELRALIVAEREVLFYAQSGAGKTSLLNALVIPALEDKGFHVLPVARIGSDLPPNIKPDAVKNVFVSSALLTLAGKDADPHALLDHTLDSFVGSLLENVPKNHPPVLIFDQFEELFTTHRERWQDAEGFIRQVRQALDTLPSLGVVFAMREDHVAALDPYAPIFSRRLRARFRMERLGPQGALTAVTRPAEKAGYVFAPQVAERLVDDLRRIKVARPSQAGDNQEATVEGPFIEPVQLQVVCNQLWANLPDQKDNAIQWDQVQQYGDIDQALTDFYASALAQVTAKTGVNEQRLRRWFGKQLITPMNTRGLALRGPQETSGLPNTAVKELESLHLIRAEVRAGARWYELVHDRLIDPILRSNQAWEIAHETPLRAIARRWNDMQDTSMLYRGAALDEALEWIRNRPQEIEAHERQFLQASQRAEQISRKKRRWVTVGSIAAVLILLLMAVLTFVAIQGRDKADEQTQIAQSEAASRATAQQDADQQRWTAEAQATDSAHARNTAIAAQSTAEALQNEAQAQSQLALARQLAAQSQSALDDTGEGLERSLLLASESISYAHTLEGDQALRYSLARMPRIVKQMQIEGWVQAVAFSPDGALLAAGGGEWGRKGSVHVWQAASGQEIAQLEHEDVVLALAFSPDGRWLASGDGSGTARVWELASGQEIAQVKLQGHVDTVAFSDACAAATPGCEPWVIAASSQAVGITSVPQELRVWQVSTEQTVAQMLYANDSWSKTLDLDERWTISQDTESGLAFSLVQDALNGQAVLLKKCCFGSSLADNWLAAGFQDGSIIVRDVSGSQAPSQLTQSSSVTALAFDTQGQLLASASPAGTVRVWQLSSEQSTAWMMHNAGVEALAFNPDGNWLATGSQDGQVTLWETWPQQTKYHVKHQGVVMDVAFGPTGQWVAAGIDNGRQGQVSVWDMNSGDQVAQITTPKPVREIAFSPDGTWLATKAIGGDIWVWEIDTYTQISQISQEQSLFGGSNMAFSPNGEWLISAGDDNTARVWQSDSGQELAHIAHGSEVHAVAFSPDGQWAASASGTWEQGQVRVWLADTGQEIARQDYKTPINTLAFSPDGDWLLAGGGNIGSSMLQPGSLYLLEAATGHELAHISTEGPVTIAAFDPAGKQMLAASLLPGELDTFGQLQVWAVSTKANVSEIARMPHERSIDSAQFSNGGKWVLSSDGSAYVWQANNGLQVARMVYDQQQVRVVAFSPECINDDTSQEARCGRWVASGDLDGTLQIWWWWPQDLRQQACARLTRNLTAKEWRYYMGQIPYQATCAGLPAPED